MRSNFNLRTLALAVLGFAALLIAVPAGATDKVLGNMMTVSGVYDRDSCNAGYVPAPPSAAFVFGVSKAKFKYQNTPTCKGQINLIKLSGLALGDGVAGSGDEVICLINHQLGGACHGFILRGEVMGSAAAQKVKIAFKGDVDMPAGVCPFPLPAHITSIECYEPDVAFNAFAACGTVGGALVPFVSDPTQGWCNFAGAYVPNPATPVIAVQGVLF